MNSKTLALISVNAALYALSAYATSYIESPWGIGQFRPAIVIPFYFAMAFGPMVGGIGAALGTFIASIFRYGQPWLTLVSGTPGNFIGFYLVGVVLYKKFTWTRFLIASLVGLLAGNITAAFGVLSAAYLGIYPPIKQISVLPISLQMAFVIGLTVFWMATMIPFVLLIVPPLLRATKHLLPAHVSQGLGIAYSERKSLMYSLSVIGSIALSLGLAAVFYPELFRMGGAQAANAIGSVFTLLGIALISSGIAVYLKMSRSVSTKTW